MDGLTLLAEAAAAGLTVEVDGDRLRVTGPKSAAAIVRRIAEHKAAILAGLARKRASRLACAARNAAGRPETRTESAQTIGENGADVVDLPLDDVDRAVLEGIREGRAGPLAPPVLYEADIRRLAKKKA